VVSLNVGAIREALTFKPDIVLSLHIVASPAAVATARLVGASTVQYFHADEIRFRPRLARFAGERSDAVIAVSRYTRTLVTGLGVDQKVVRCIPNGVDVPAELPVVEKSIRPRLITVARLTKSYKGHDVVMRAMPLIKKRVPDAEWVIIGDGRVRPALERQARALGVERDVAFMGAVSDDQRDRLLRSAHVFVMPSRQPSSGAGGEGFGIVYLEANALGLPVVAGAVGGALDAVEDGETGLLIDPTDHVAVANAVAELLLDRDRADTLGARGRHRARDFSWSKIAGRVEDLILELSP